jgi:uncharacterized protein YbaP (TraB family)
VKDRVWSPEVNPSEVYDVLQKASIPEHSIPFMQAMSGGDPFLIGPYLFIAAEDWILAIGYPLEGEYTTGGFEDSLFSALRRTQARNCWAICPSLPDRLKPYRQQLDHYYILPLNRPVPARLERISAKAAVTLRVEESALFTPEHRRLWSEFMTRDLPPHVLELYARTESVLPLTPGLSLLNAWDRKGHLAASLLLDSAPGRFVSYLLGAHSRKHYTPHASDLLFLEMIRAAKQRRKEYLHLGFGVNAGIRRFKVKWGGRSGLPYEMAEWREKDETALAGGNLIHMVTSMSSFPREIAARHPEQKPFAMVWELEKGGRRSWIGGTAHFFRYSFEHSFRRLFKAADTVLFEGPLDQDSMNQVAEIGNNPTSGSPRLIDALTEEEIRRLERVVCGPRGFWARFLGLELANPPDVHNLLSRTRPWMAFFSLWSSYLASKGWTQSVDMEAWQVAHELGKRVHCMETIPEQIETLESIPIPRIVNYFRQCRNWNRYTRHNLQAYLKGDLEGMAGTSIEFPTRTEMVIHKRDARFLKRMEPFLEEGRSVVLVGSAHLLDLRRMLAEKGFKLRRAV